MRAKNFACATGLRYNAKVKIFPRQPATGFSLIELLIVVAILAVLSALFYGSLTGKRARSQRQLCGDNLQKIYLALQIYANDDGGKLPEIPAAQTSETPLNLLVPKYTADTSIFICPAGRDSQIPAGEPLTQNKISYAYYMGFHLAVNENAAPFVLLSDRQINTDPKRAGDLVFSPDGKSPGNNHGKSGGNFLFSDGSVQSSGPRLTFSLAEPTNVVLLNPKP